MCMKCRWVLPFGSLMALGYTAHWCPLAICTLWVPCARPAINLYPTFTFYERSYSNPKVYIKICSIVFVKRIQRTGHLK